MRTCASSLRQMYSVGLALSLAMVLVFGISSFEGSNVAQAWVPSGGGNNHGGGGNNHGGGGNNHGGGGIVRVTNTVGQKSETGNVTLNFSATQGGNNSRSTVSTSSGPVASSSPVGGQIHTLAVVPSASNVGQAFTYRSGNEGEPTPPVSSVESKAPASSGPGSRPTTLPETGGISPSMLLVSALLLTVVGVFSGLGLVVRKGRQGPKLQQDEPSAPENV